MWLNLEENNLDALDNHFRHKPTSFEYPQSDQTSSSKAQIENLEV